MKNLSLHSTIRRAVLLPGVLLVGVVAGTAVGRATAGAPIAVPDALQRPDLVQPFNDFFRAYDVVTNSSYYAPLPDRKRLIYAAINGMLTGGTGDAHTIYISPEDNLALQQSQSGSFEGIGAYVDMTAHGISIIPLPGSPAADAGLRAGDVIVRIDGRDVTTLTEDQTVALLRGVAGTRVTLGIQRSGVHGVFYVTLTRRRITVPDVSSRAFGDIAYLRIAQFGAATGRDVSTALHKLLARHPRSLVLDLRDNPGGLVDQAVDVNSQFLPGGSVVLYEKDQKGHLDAPLRTLGGGQALTVPMVALVNDGTASAGEITAGALQDNGRARIVGITTYGKGSVQQEYDLPDDSSLRVTIRLWLTPHKRLVQSRGITPDVVVDSPVDDGSAADAQLARALQLLRGGR